MIVIGLHGKQGAGKSTVARKYMAESAAVVKCSFADPLYLMTGMLLRRRPGRVRDLDKNEPLAEFGGKTLREALQTLGTEWGRELISESIWVDLMQGELKFLEDDGYRVAIIDDVRFPNEVDLIKSWPNHIIAHVTGRRADVLAEGHASEEHSQYLLQNTTHLIKNDKNDGGKAAAKRLIQAIDRIGSLEE